MIFYIFIQFFPIFISFFFYCMDCQLPPYVFFMSSSSVSDVHFTFHEYQHWSSELLYGLVLASSILSTKITHLNLKLRI